MSSIANDLIADCRGLGMMLTPTAVGVKCLAPKGRMTAALKSAINANRDEIRQLLIAGLAAVDVGQSSGISGGASWRAGATQQWPADVGAAADFMLLVPADDLPAVPFAFRPGAIVVDSAKFLASLQSDVRKGPAGPRARLGSLQSALRRLRAMMLESPARNAVGH